MYMQNILIFPIVAVLLYFLPQRGNVVVSDFTKEIIEYYIDKGFNHEDDYVSVLYGSMTFSTYDTSGVRIKNSKGMLEISSDKGNTSEPKLTIKGVPVIFHESTVTSNPFFTIIEKKPRHIKRNRIIIDTLYTRIIDDSSAPENKIMDIQLLSEIWRFCFNEDGSVNPFLSNTYSQTADGPTDFESTLEIARRYFQISSPDETDMKLYFPYPDNNAQPVIGNDALYELIRSNLDVDTTTDSVCIALKIDEKGNASLDGVNLQPFETNRYKTLKFLAEEISGMSFYPASFRGYNVKTIYLISIPPKQDNKKRLPVLCLYNGGAEF